MDECEQEEGQCEDESQECRQNQESREPGQRRPKAVNILLVSACIPIREQGMGLRTDDHLNQKNQGSDNCHTRNEAREDPISRRVIRYQGRIDKRDQEICQHRQQEDHRRLLFPGFDSALGHDHLCLPQPDNDRDQGDDDEHYDNRREDVVDALRKALPEPGLRDLNSLVGVCLRGIGQDEPDQERRARPVEAAHHDAQEPDHEERHEVHQVLARLERREGDDHEQERGQQAERNCRQPRDSARGADTDQRSDYVGQRQKPDDRVSDV